MARYAVEWIERLNRFAEVEADSEAEAIAKAKAGDVVEGSQDSEPGKPDHRTLKISARSLRSRVR